MLKLKSLLFISFSIITISKCESINYCNADDICDISKQNPLCKFQFRESANHCTDFEVTLKTDEDKIAILDKINNRRDKVASGEIRSLPPADSMLKLKWNIKLEASAQRWADQCVKHNVPDLVDNCRNLDNVYVGQNIATIHGDAPGLTPSVLVDVWYMELLHTNSSILSSYQPSSKIGNSFYDYFTQLVWAESSQVGCGAVKFKERYEDESGPRHRTIYRLVCNFAPGGNRWNKTVYTTGLPCSRCPPGYSCDSIYKSLCSFRVRVEENDTQIRSSVDTFINSTEFNVSEYGRILTEFPSITLNSTTKLPRKGTTNKNDTLPTADLKPEEDTYTPFDYFSHLHEFTRQVITETTIKPHICKDVLAVEEFIELLKKKLSSDPMFKDALTTNSYSDHSESATDPSVVAFVSRIYSKKTPLTTSKVTENDIVNSTLLVDLVEAVIFRNGDKMPAVKETEGYSPGIFQVNPVKIQAELAEVKQNQDFTGHYFFPEEDDETSSETAESYYDTSNIAISDVVLEIKDLKRTTTVKDFLYEILESDSVTGNPMDSSSLLLPGDSTVYISKHDYMKRNLKDFDKKKEE